MYGERERKLTRPAAMVEQMGKGQEGNAICCDSGTNGKGRGR